MSPIYTQSVRGLTGAAGVFLLSLAASARADETGTLDVKPFPPLSVRIEREMEMGTAQPLQVAALPPSLLTGSTVTAAKTKQLDPTGVVGKVVPIAIRLGAMVSPRTKFAGGADFSFPRLHVGPFYARIDAEAIVSANFGAVSTLVPITFNGVYAKSLVGGARIYGGGGIGPYFGEVTRFGGKLFIGGDFNNRFGLEADLHFAGQGEALVTVMARLGL